MWIRSQNKMFLVDVNNIYAYTSTKTNITMLRTLEFDLGKYSTKEKALKVLDMIQELILYTYYGGNEPKKLFQMPQDSEV